MTFSGREMRTMVDKDGVLTLSLEDVMIGDPGADELVVRVEAAPINPSDLGTMLVGADVSGMSAAGTADRPLATLQLPEARVAFMGSRIGQSFPIGIEGAGTVVAAGAQGQHLVGRRVGMMGGGMYADYRKVSLQQVNPIPDGASAADGASMFVNPLTALGFVETALREGHKAIVHTAAASNLGQMLQKICLKDGIPLVNIVRSEEQVSILRDIGATHVVNSRDDDFLDQLTEAVAQSGATIAFDAIGGGTMGSDILTAMERAAMRKVTGHMNYGSDTFKKLYIYGALNPTPIIFNPLSFGFTWGAGGWLLFPFLQKAGAETNQRLRQRVADELTTTFASHYTRTIGLAEALQPDVIRAFERRATGEKYLIDPTLN